MCGGAPEASNKDDTAEKAAQYNLEAYKQTMAGNAMNQDTPFGKLTYDSWIDPTTGLTRYSAKQVLDPRNQALLDATYSSRGMAGNAATNILQGAYSGAPNILGGADSLMQQRLGAQLDYLNPTFDRQTDRMDNQLRNQGIMPGTEAYRNSMNDLRQSQGQTVSGAIAQFMPQAFSEAMQNYKLPAEMAGYLANLSNPLGMGLTTTPQGQLQSVDYAGITAAADQQNLAAHQANQAATNALISGLGSAAGSMMMMSDERMKTDIERVGWLDNGLPVYRFRFRMGGPVQIGVMAQDVEASIPEAVVEIGGVKFVDYAQATETKQ